jgi:DNA helicase IV
MKNKTFYQNLIDILEPKKTGDHQWFLDLLDEGRQKEYENTHIDAVMKMLRISRLREHKDAVKAAQDEIKRIETEEEKNAENYCKVTVLLKEIESRKEKIDSYRCFFDEPYFARMDLVDQIDGYNSYYIGKKGDVKLEIVDWRAPIARKYYQKSRAGFSINEYDYKTILRRAIRAKEGKIVDFRDEFLAVRDYLTSEEIGGKDKEIIYDAYLQEIIDERKEEPSVKDIIETIQEKQYEIITQPDEKNFVLQGCAGSGKTMVMLHRLSYLMYNNDDIKSRDVLVITPSNSFNAFIDELATILQLERVKTLTAYDYFLQILKNEKIDLSDKIDETQRESEEYLAYVYSPKFIADVKKKLDKIYDSLYGLFTGDECKDYIKTILLDCKKQLSAYESIKNSSLRIRRAVLGEIKEKKEGGLYYTKPFRDLMNCVLDIQDFFDGTLKSENAKNPDYFYRHLSSFYKSSAFVAKKTTRIVLDAEKTLEELKFSLEKEIIDLKRYKQRIGSMEIFTYADRIDRREKLLEETQKILQKVLLIGESNTAFAEFYSYLRGEKNFSSIGEGEGFVDIARFLYRETVKKYKQKYGLTSKKMYPSDAYALYTVCSLTGRRLTPSYSYLFVDEGQDISVGEYELLKRVNPKAAFNVFGDIEQNITPWRGIRSWSQVFPDYEVFLLNQNYRNTHQIVEFVAETLDVDMKSIGFNGPKIEEISARNITAFFKNKNGLKAVICSEKTKSLYAKKTYNFPAEKGRISKTKVNFMTVYESKGLEFTSVAVIPDGMTKNEKYIAYTRALKALAVVKD